MTDSHVVNENHAANRVSIFGWDNEFGFHQSKIESFKVSEKLISNGEFLSFVKDAGYTK
jgi:formylglycine-generating enzyme required for sulfatase activity